MLKGLITLTGFYLLGDFVATLFAWPIPGSVMGMLLLFVFLILRGGIARSLEDSANGLLTYLPLFIVPASVGIINYWDLLQSEGLHLLLIIVLSLLVGIPVCGWIMAGLMPRQPNQREDQNNV